MNETQLYPCDKSMITENLDEAEKVTEEIDEETWKKIVNEENLQLKNNHKMTKPGYEDVSLLSLYTDKKSFCSFLNYCLFISLCSLFNISL